MRMRPHPVALHIVNAEYDTGVRNTMNITCLIRDVVNIVSEYLNIELQEESLHYCRFISSSEISWTAHFYGADARG